jgi:ABC-type glycerol-3-phosphate transport system substrate-binding protein
VRLRRISLVLASLLGLAACGASSDPSSTAAEADASGDSDVPSALPDVDVVDVGAGATVNLRSLLPSDRPLLIWFWAPH